MIKRIMITGPESTGKSWLALNMATHYHTQWVPERARSYLQEISRPYKESDLLQIAKDQLKLEDALAKKASRLLFCDTGMMVLKIWSEHAFGRCHPFIKDQLAKRDYALFLLPDIDLPWEPDPQREHPNLREHFFSLYQQQLKDYGKTFTIVSGSGPERLQNAIRATEAVLE